jgi:isopenicillin-N epimerase
MTRRDGGDDLARHWDLEAGVAFLNHGSFGACPRVVRERQARLRDQMERQPVRFFVREAPGLLDEARRALARFVGADPEGLAFVPNASTGINAVLRSVAIPAGAELLVTDHAYNAARNVIDYVAAERGARVVVAHLPFPLQDVDAAEAADTIFRTVIAAATPRNALALVDHVTSPTALVLPVARIVAELEGRGVRVLVDGAHAPGMLDLDVGAVSASWYVGNCHKWLCAPKSAGFLVARDDVREAVRPAVISHGANAPIPRAHRFRREFDWMGTTDPTPALCVPDALRFLEAALPGGFAAVRARNHRLVVSARSRIAAALGTALPCPDELLGSMASLPLPTGFGLGDHADSRPASALDEDPLHARLVDEYGIEVPVLASRATPARVLRISAHLYNRDEDYDRLVAALRAIGEAD